MHKVLLWKKMFYHRNTVLHVLARECKNVVLALTDCKNVNPSYVYHLSKFSLKNLFLREFAKMVNV